MPLPSFSTGPHLPGENCNHSNSVECGSSRGQLPQTVLTPFSSPLHPTDEVFLQTVDYAGPDTRLEPESAYTGDAVASRAVLPPRKTHIGRKKNYTSSSDSAVRLPILRPALHEETHENGSRHTYAIQSDHHGDEIPLRNQQAYASNFNQDFVLDGPQVSPRSGYDVEEALPESQGCEDNVEEPRNGRTAWLHAATGFFVVANCWGLGNAWGLFQVYYEIAYLPGVSSSSIAWIGSTQLALVFGLGFPVGKLVDMGYFHWVFYTGTCLMVLGIFCTAWCTRLATLWVVQGLLTGVGMGMLFVSGITAMMTWFDERKISMAMGLAAAGSCVGGTVYILLVRHLLVHQGFATTMIVLGSLAGITMIPANLVFRVRGENYKVDKGKREHAESVSVPKQRVRWCTIIEPAYIFAAMGLFFSFMGVYFGFVYMVLYGSTVLHLSNEAATNLLIFMLAANLPGRFLPALISDNCIGPLNTIIPSAFLSSAVVWLWAASDNNRASLIVIACFYGFVSAGVQVLYISTVYSFCVETEEGTPEGRISIGGSRRSAKTKLRTNRIGMRAGGLYTAIGLACLIGTPIGGALISYRTSRGMPHTFLGAQIFAGLSLLLGGMLLLASRVSKVGWQAKRA